MFSKWIIIGMILATLGGLATTYVIFTQSKIESLTINNAVLEENSKALKVAAEQNAKTVDELVLEQEKVHKEFLALQTEYQIIRSQKAELEARLNKHNLTELALTKPELLEKILNSASKDALRCFEIISGAPLSDKERSAKNEREFNAECPWLFPRN